MRRWFVFDAAVIVLTAMVTITTAKVNTFDGYYCFVRCIAKCLNSTTGTLPTCSNQCTKFNNSALCASGDSTCWLKCKDLVDGVDANARPPQPKDLKTVYHEDNPRLVNITWAPVPLVSLYVLEYDDQFDNWTNPKRKEMTAPMLSDFAKPESGFCNQYIFRVASVTPQGVSQFSNQYLLPMPMPKMEPALNVSFRYSDEPYQFMDYYKSNATIFFTIEYNNLTEWPLGAKDISVDVVVAMIGCDITDLSSAVPTPQLRRIPGTNQLSTTMSSDMMTKRCQLLYYPTVVKSEECDSSYAVPMNPYYVKITCDNVQNSNCVSDGKRNDPLCGQVTDFKFNPLNADKVNVNDPAANLSVEISFKPITRLTNVNNKIPLYYIAVYGDATQFDNDGQAALQGVNMSNTIGQVTTCDRLQLNETCNSNITTAIISDIQFDRQYGVMVCAVIDKDHLQLPRIDPSDYKSIKIRADGLLIKTADYRGPSLAVIIGDILIIFVPLASVVIAVIFGTILCYSIKKQHKQKAMTDMKMTMMKVELEARYTDLPKKNDDQELKLRNLIINNEQSVRSSVKCIAELSEEKMEREKNVYKSSYAERSNASEELLHADNGYQSLRVPLQDQIDYLAFDTKFEMRPDQLKISELVGHGHFSNVYHGLLSQTIGKVPVAVKMPKTIVASRNRQERTEEKRMLRCQRKLLRDELKIMIHLQSQSGGHGNVLKLVGAITTNRADFCMMTEYCEWGSMDQFLRSKHDNGEFENELIFDEIENKQAWKGQRDSNWSENFESRRENGRITTSDLSWFALQIARAMQFLIEKKVLHRDVALRNVLLKSDYTLKVADFGLSRKLKDGDEAYHLWKNSTGLPIRYIAPESLTTGTFTFHSECWSYGVVLWELFTFAKHQPYSTEYEGSDSNQLFFDFLIQHLASGQRLTLPDIVSIPIMSLVMDLWHEDPTQRPTFQSCRKTIRQELMNSCQKILLSEQSVPTYTSETSLIQVENVTINAQEAGCLQSNFERTLERCTM